MVDGVPADDLQLNAGGIINVNGNFSMNGNSDGYVSGTLSNNNTLNLSGGTALTFNAGGTYVHNIDGGAIPNENFVVGSNCIVSGVTVTAPTNLNENFGNFTWDCAGQSVDISLINPSLANIQGDLNITNTNGNDLILNNTINIVNNDFVVGASGIIQLQNGNVIQNINNAIISGIVKTEDQDGFSGAGNTSINPTTLTLNAGSTIEYNAAGAQNITGTAAIGANYSNLIISGSGTKTLANDITVNNNLTVNAGATMEVGGDDISVSGTTSISGTFSDNNGGGNTNLTNVTMQGGTLSHVDNVDISGTLTASSGTNTITGAGGITVTGATTINAGATLVNSGTGNNYYNGAVINNGTWSSPGAINIRFQGGLTNNGTMSATGTGTYTFDQFNQSIAGTQPIVFQGAVNISNGVTLTNDNTSGITIQGQLNGLGGASAFVNNAGRTLYYQNATMPMATGNFTVTAANNNVYYSLTSAQTVRNTTYQNLFISGSGIKTANAAFTVQGNLNIASGATLYDNGNLITVNGNVTNNGAATTTGGAAGISITGAGGHSITGNGSYQRLTIATAGNTTTMVDGSASFSVDNLIVSAGTLVIGNNTLTINTQLTGTNLTASSAAGSSMVLNGTSPNFLGTAGIPSLVNFTLNNAAGTTMANNFEVTGTPYPYFWYS
ncbi:MAG: S-layer family protein [Chloroflexia bacterium]|nr:S-layer family protein [Chloroflexia bacterium]